MYISCEQIPRSEIDKGRNAVVELRFPYKISEGRLQCSLNVLMTRVGPQLPSPDIFSVKEKLAMFASCCEGEGIDQIRLDGDVMKLYLPPNLNQAATEERLKVGASECFCLEVKTF